MRFTNRRRAMVLFILLGILLVGLAVALNVGWIIFNWHRALYLFLGLLFFLMLIAGLILNTIFLVREVRRNEQQDSFLNTVTHELKTPIASIRLYLETLQRRPVEPAKAQEFYALMLADTDRLIHTVEQVLKAGEVGHKTGPSSALEIHLQEMIAQCIELVRLRHRLEGEITLAIAPTEPVFVLGNGDELRTVFGNVLENAVKYSPRDRLHVAVEIYDDGRDVEVLVRDRGRGIPPTELKQVFKRFYRVNEPGQRVRGTGLGLFIAQGILRRHGGSISAESWGTNRGTTMRIRLPKGYE